MPGDLADLCEHVRQVLGGIDEYKNIIAYAYTPITRSSTTPDLFIYAVNDNVSAWVSKRAAFAGSEVGRALAGIFKH